MVNSKDKDSIDLILYNLQEHGKRLDAIQDQLNDIKKTMANYTPKLNKLESENVLSASQQDFPQSVLVVDDDPNIIKTFKMILEGVGYTVDSAQNALDAIRKASKIHFDLVIVDMNLPDTLGDELANRLIEENNKLKVIMVTGYSNYREQLDRNREVIEALMKPITPEELIAATQKILKKKIEPHSTLSAK